MNFGQGAVLIVSAFVAGGINAVAGGGTMVSYPALVWALGDPITANAMSTVALLTGSVSSMVAYRSDLRGTKSWIAILTLPSILGGLIGAWLLLKTPASTFSRIVPYLVLGATGLRAVSGPLNRWMRQSHEGERSSCWWAGAVGFQLIVAIYGGYFGAGIGIMMLAAFGLLGLSDIHQMNGLKCFFAGCINLVAAIWFIWSGKVIWLPALVMTFAAVAGGYAGASASRKLGRGFANAAVLVIGVGVGIWLLWQSHSTNH